MGMYGDDGGGTTIDNTSYEEGLGDSLAAQLQYAPQMYDMERSLAHGKPAYAKLEREVAMDSLLGAKVPGADWQRGTEYEGFNFDEYQSNSIDKEKLLQEQFDRDDFQNYLDDPRTKNEGAVWIEDRYSGAHNEHYKKALAKSEASKAALTSHQAKYKEKSEGYQAARELATRHAPENDREGGGMVDVMAGGIEMDFTTGGTKTPKDLANQKLLQVQAQVGAKHMEGMGARMENGRLLDIDTGQPLSETDQASVMRQVEEAVGSDKMVWEAQKAFDSTDGELSPEMETVNRKAGFSAEGKFLGLQALQRDMSEYDIRRQRTADVRDAKELGTSLTSAYRDQGNIRSAVQDVGKIAGTNITGRPGITDRGANLESKASSLAGQIGRVGQGRLTPQGYQQGGPQGSPENMPQPNLSVAEQGAAAMRGERPVSNQPQKAYSRIDDMAGRYEATQGGGEQAAQMAAQAEMHGPQMPMQQGPPNPQARTASSLSAQPENPWAARSAGLADQRGMGTLRGTMAQQASSELALGGDLTARERRRLTDSASAASSARGRNYDTKAIVDEVASLDQASLARKGMRQGFAATVAGQEGQLQSQELQREQQRLEGGINRALQAGQSELAADLQSQLANIGIQQTNMNAQMGAAGLDVARDVSLQQVNEQLYRQGIGQEFGMATNRVGIEQATSADPYLAVAGRATGAGVAQGSNMYNQGMGTNAQGYNTQIYDPSAGLGYMMNQQNNQTSMAAANIGANSRRDAGLMSMFGSIGAAAVCWVAREIYGSDNPKWLRFREFMVNRADDDLREYYIEYGPSIAHHLSKAGPGERTEMEQLMNKILEVS